MVDVLDDTLVIVEVLLEVENLGVFLHLIVSVFDGDIVGARHFTEVVHIQVMVESCEVDVIGGGDLAV